MKTDQIYAIGLLCFFFIAGSIHAQDKKQPMQSKSKTTDMQAQSLESDQDYILRMEGETYIRKKGKLMEVKNDRMIDGMRVTAQGKVIKRSGAEYNLKDGEAMTMDGAILKFKENQVMNDKMMMMQEQCRSMMEVARETEEDVSLMNEKINLLNRKTELLNQKMKLMNDQVSKNKKMSKESQEEMNQTMNQLDDQIRETELRLQKLDEEMVRMK